MPLQSFSPKEPHDHLKRTLAKSEWSAMKGWHIFRHSFIGICTSSGIDQRFIDEWVGHQTDEQRRRYRHLARRPAGRSGLGFRLVHQQLHVHAVERRRRGSAVVWTKRQERIDVLRGRSREFVLGCSRWRR